MRALRISLIVFGILMVLGVIGDRVALYIAEGQVASRARDALALSGEPDVSIRGFPFLTQVAGSHLNRVDLSFDQYEADVDGQLLTLEDLKVQLDDVRVSGGYSSAIADAASGEGLIRYDELSRAYGEVLAAAGTGITIEFGYAEGGRLELTPQVSVGGMGVDLGSVPGDIVLEGDQLRLEVAEEDIPDVGGADVQQRIREQLNQQHSVGGLPDGLRLSSVKATPEGVVIAVSGTAVNLIS